MASLEHLCRDCLETFHASGEQGHCPRCGSSRVIAHMELHNLSMAHIDCDAFYASVEKRDNPDLIGKPVIIGGGRRGVVATCCYIARMSGVRSAMPMFTARRKCPDAVIIKPQMSKYSKVSRQIRDLMNTLSPLVEPISIDEAFVDLAGTHALHKAFPALVLARFAKRVETEIGVSVSIGLSHNKFLAKIASDLEKPRGMALIGQEETMRFLASKPISIIYGVGKVFAQKLKKDGFVTIGQLQTHDPDDLARRYGEMGARLARLSQGIDNRALSVGSGTKSISSETTFGQDISDHKTLSTRLLDLSERVAERMKSKGLVGDTVTLKLKTGGFQSRTRAKHLSLPTQLAHVIFESGRHLLEREVDGTPFRLIGIGLSGLDKAGKEDPTDLFEPQIARKAAAERAMDKVRSRFGRDAVVRGQLYRQKDKRKNKTSLQDNSAPKQQIAGPSTGRAKEQKPKDTPT